MARIVVASWMVRYPLGGNLSWTLQWLVGFQRLGHEVYLVEKADLPNSCWDPARGVLSDDGSYGVQTVNELLRRFELDRQWCFAEATERYYGLTRRQVEEVIRSADLVVDIGNHGAWAEESAGAGLRILVDGEPGATQMKWENKLAAGEPLPQFDHYFSNGANVGSAENSIPTAGKQWRPLFNPVVAELFNVADPPPNAAFTTVMNWQAHGKLVYGGTTFGQKDVEFEKFLDLPRRTTSRLEVAVSGRIPREALTAGGWRVRSAREVTASYGAYRDYIRTSRGEFSVAKQVYVATTSGWFSDRSAAYLASGRPVVLQETGFSQHLPCGCGLFAVRTLDEAAAALEEIEGNWGQHSAGARDVACEHLEARVVLGRLLRDLGMGKAPV